MSGGRGVLTEPLREVGQPRPMLHRARAEQCWPMSRQQGESLEAEREPGQLGSRFYQFQDDPPVPVGSLARAEQFRARPDPGERLGEPLEGVERSRFRTSPPGEQDNLEADVWGEDLGETGLDRHNRWMGNLARCQEESWQDEQTEAGNQSRGRPGGVARDPESRHGLHGPVRSAMGRDVTLSLQDEPEKTKFKIGVGHIESEGLECRMPGPRIVWRMFQPRATVVGSDGIIASRVCSRIVMTDPCHGMITSPILSSALRSTGGGMTKRLCSWRLV